jgi:DNA-directed RNA polymerase specialized sigma24 family protein
MQERVRREVEKLTRRRQNTDRNQEIVRLKDEEDLSFAKIAKRLDMEVGAVKMAYRRQKLQGQSRGKFQ